MRRAAILAAAILATGLAGPASGAGSEEFRWAGTVAAGAAVEVKGVNGAVVATGASGGEVEVTAVKKGRRSDPSAVKIEVVEHPGGVTVCAVYPSEGAPNECVPGKGGRMKVRDNDVNVEFRVRVPAGVRFVGRTVNGGIRASGLTADAEAETVNGGIKASLGRADWSGTLELKTVNGGIRMTLPESVGADVRASTVNGDIETDFPLTVSGRISRRKVEGTIGGGGRVLELQTVNGGIELRKATTAR